MRVFPTIIALCIILSSLLRCDALFNKKKNLFDAEHQFRAFVIDTIWEATISHESVWTHAKKIGSFFEKWKQTQTTKSDLKLRELQSFWAKQEPKGFSSILTNFMMLFTMNFERRTPTGSPLRGVILKMYRQQVTIMFLLSFDWLFLNSQKTVLFKNIPDEQLKVVLAVMDILIKFFREKTENQRPAVSKVRSLFSIFQSNSKSRKRREKIFNNYDTEVHNIAPVKAAEKTQMFGWKRKKEI